MSLEFKLRVVLGRSCSVIKARLFIISVWPFLRETLKALIHHFSIWSMGNLRVFEMFLNCSGVG